MPGVLIVLYVLLAAAVLFVAAVVATREDGGLAEAPPDRADTGLPIGPLQPEDVAEVRFGMVLRGYRMSEVDDVLARLAGELASRDRQIADLQVVADEPETEPVAVTPAPDVPALPPPLVEEPAALVAAETAVPQGPPTEVPAPEQVPASEPVVEADLDAGPVEPAPQPALSEPLSEPLPEPLPAEPVPAQSEQVPAAEPVPLDVPEEDDDLFPEVLSADPVHPDLPEAQDRWSPGPVDPWDDVPPTGEDDDAP